MSPPAPPTTAGVSEVSSKFTCPPCGLSFVTRLQLDAHALTHAAAAQAANARDALDGLGKKIFARR